MGKSISGTVIYEMKITNPNAIANFNEPKLAEAAAQDFLTFVGKPTQGFGIKGNDAKALVEKVKKDLIGGKVKQPWLRAGISGTDLIFLVTDQQPTKYEQSCVLFKDYTTMREKQKTQSAVVVNAQKGDKIIDESSDKMAKAKGTTVVNAKDLDLEGHEQTKPIILLAHGSEDKRSTGEVWGQKFSGASPDQIVSYLKKKGLSNNYSGTIYLDGCFTAQVGSMDNYTQKVWELLKSGGMKNVKVKGNLGAAATLDDGTEQVTTPEAKKKSDALLIEANKALALAIAQFKSKKDNIWKTKYMKKNDEKGFDKDSEVVKLNSQIKTVVEQHTKKYEEDCKKIPGCNVLDLVGQFGLEVLK